MQMETESGDLFNDTNLAEGIDPSLFDNFDDAEGVEDDLDTKSCMPSIKSSGNIACITESRGSASEIGLAIFDLDDSILRVFQLLDTPTYINTIKLLHQYSVQTILFSETSLTLHYQSKLAILLAQTYDQDQLVVIPRKLFSSENGAQIVNDYAVRGKTTDILKTLDKKYYALASISAWFQSCADSVGLQHGTVEIRFQCPKEFMLLDVSSVTGLEIILSNSGNPAHSLLGSIDYTLTKMGKRRLRNALLQPFKNVHSIRSVSNMVKELTENVPKLQSLREALTNFADVDALVSGLARNNRTENSKLPEKNVQLVLMAVEIMDCAKSLKEKIEKPDSLSYPHLSKDMELIEPLLEKLLAVISPDVLTKRKSYKSHSTRCYAIKPEVDVLLDVARKTLKETTDDVYEYAEGLSKSLDLPLKLKYFPDKGFTLQMQKISDTPGMLFKLPESLIPLSETKSVCTCTTLQLLKLNARIRESLDEIFLITDKLLESYLVEMKENISLFYSLSEMVGSIDYICSAAEYFQQHPSVFPEFGQAIALKGARNPILEKIGVSCVPNDYFCSPGHEFTVVSGVNMSGKTTYLKTLAVIHLMAQIGYPVPCEFASLSPREALLCRFGSDDDLEPNCSSFLKELREISHCFHCSTDQSLVLVDELGRGTSISDGLAISTSIYEEFIKRKTFMFAVTHYLRLLKYLESIPSVSVISLQVDEIGDHYNFQYRASQGHPTNLDYGIKVARICGLPNDIINHAITIKAKFEQNTVETTEDAMILNRRIQKRKLLIETAARLKNSGFEPEAVELIKKEFYESLNEIALME